MEVNGIAHIFLTASNFERSREFYRKLLPFLGLKPVMDNEAFITASAVAPRSRSARHRRNTKVLPLNKIASACTILLPRPRARRCR